MVVEKQPHFFANVARGVGFAFRKYRAGVYLPEILRYSGEKLSDKSVFEEKENIIKNSINKIEKIKAQYRINKL